MKNLPANIMGNGSNYLSIFANYYNLIIIYIIRSSVLLQDSNCSLHQHVIRLAALADACVQSRLHILAYSMLDNNLQNEWKTFVFNVSIQVYPNSTEEFSIYGQYISKELLVLPSLIVEIPAEVCACYFSSNISYTDDIGRLFYLPRWYLVGFADTRFSRGRHWYGPDCYN